ncbi:MAG: vitamin B12 dependent-methionine synthase activation domain-containing protein [Candidatus Zixiibacteriota bacterium]
MRKIVTIRTEETVPGPEVVLQAQGLPPSATPNDQTLALYRAAISTYLLLSQPVAMYSQISIDDFRSVFNGDGANAKDAPLGHIYPRSDALALFAVTVGETLTAEITRLFETNDFPAGAMLDSVASQAAEMAAACVEREYLNDLKDSGTNADATATLPFSPGYCGWNLSSQIPLFHALHPEEIGIILSESCLMSPLKSISGVFVVGPKEIFQFDDKFDFCEDCQTRSCRARLAAIRSSA